jgi:tRNA(adenine34) deaminase
MLNTGINPFVLLIVALMFSIKISAFTLRSKRLVPHESKFNIKISNEISRLFTSIEVIGEDEKDASHMRLALRHAQHAFREKEVPIGAVIVDSNGVVLATARNKVEGQRDATAHAEIDCIKKAAQLLGNWRLHGCTLYSTLEPCPMCMGAIQGSRIKRVVYAAADHRVGACGSWVDLISAKHPFHDVEVEGGLLQEESTILLKRFFQMRRREALESKTAEPLVIDRGKFAEDLILE